MVEEFFNEPETIVNRLRGIYDTGPEDNPNEFRREFPGRPPINYEAARRIEVLEQELERLKEKNDMHFQKYIKLKVNILKACDESRTR